MGIRNALDMAMKDSSFDRKMQAKAEAEYETLKTSIKSFKTKEKKKVNGVSDESVEFFYTLSKRIP